MRKVVSSLFITLDGIVEAPDQWQGDVFDDDLGNALTQLMALEDTILLGRKSYEEWCSFWPTSNDEPYASYINKSPKYVVSTSLDRAEWGEYDNIQVIKDHVADEVLRLKQQPGKNISIGGSPTLVRYLLNQGLVDELNLIVHPVVVGKGKHLFDENTDLRRLKLTNNRTTSKGVVILTYQPIQKD